MVGRPEFPEIVGCVVRLPTGESDLVGHRVSTFAPSKTAATGASRSVKIRTGGRIEAAAAATARPAATTPAATATAKTNVATVMPQNQMPVTPPAINPVSPHHAMVVTESAGDRDDRRWSSRGQKPRSPPGLAAAPVRPSARPERPRNRPAPMSPTPNWSTSSSATPRPAHDTADQRAMPCSRVKPTRLHSSMSSGPVTAGPPHQLGAPFEQADLLAAGMSHGRPLANATHCFDGTSARRPRTQPHSLNRPPAHRHSNVRTRQRSTKRRRSMAPAVDAIDGDDLSAGPARFRVKPDPGVPGEI